MHWGYTGQWFQNICEFYRNESTNFALEIFPTFAVLFCVKSGLLRYNIHTTKLIVFKYIVWWILTEAWTWVTTITVTMEIRYRIFLSLQSVQSYPSVANPMPSFLVPGSHWSDFCPIVLPHQEGHLCGVMLWVAREVLLTLSIMLLQFINIIAHICSSFPLIVE